jgi:hypothetical protein
MKSADPHAKVKRLVFFTWLFVGLFYFYLCYDYIRVDMNDTRLGDYVQYVAQLAGNENRSPREIRALLLVRAEELGIPLTTKQIKIQGNGPTLKISVDYDVDIDIPVFREGFYSKHYEHTASFHGFR